MLCYFPPPPPPIKIKKEYKVIDMEINGLQAQQMEQVFVWLWLLLTKMQKINILGQVCL